MGQVGVAGRQEPQHGDREHEQREERQESVEGDTPRQYLTAGGGVAALDVANPAHGATQDAPSFTLHVRMVEDA